MNISGSFPAISGLPFPAALVFFELPVVYPFSITTSLALTGSSNVFCYEHPYMNEPLGFHLLQHELPI